MSNTGEKYISFYSGLYNICKKVDTKYVRFGGFHTLEEAIHHRDYCIENDWSLDCVHRKYKKRSIRHKHVRRVHNTWQIIKQLDNKTYNFGSFRTLEAAIKHRDYCIEHNWSLDCKYVRNKKHHLPKYITPARNGRYYIQKKVGGELKLWYGFRSVEDAVRERDLLMRVGWDDDKLIELDEAEGTL